MPDNGIGTTPLGRRYGRTAEAEWQRVVSHFALNDGFALVVLIVPDSDGAALCQLMLADQLAAMGRDVLDVSPNSPSTLRQLAPLLLGLDPPEACGAVWLAAAVPISADDHAAWEMAWRWGLGTLNQNRNPLRRNLRHTLVLVGVPGLIPLFREAAPDLWSVRAMVVRIEPDPSRILTEKLGIDRRNVSRRPSAAHIPDLVLALRAIERLRGVARRERDLASAVERAARAYAGRGNAQAAEACFREALDLRDRFDRPKAIAGTLVNLGDTLLDQGRSAAAEDIFRRAMEMAEKGNASASFQSTAMDMLAHAILAQGRLEEAEEVFRRALKLAEEGRVPIESRGVMMDMMARAILLQGRAAEAEVTFRRALTLIEEGGGKPASRGITTEMLAHAIMARGRLEEAETTFRRALTLAEIGQANAVSRAITTEMLAHAVLSQGRATEAEALLVGAVALARGGGAPVDLIKLMTDDLHVATRARNRRIMPPG